MNTIPVQVQEEILNILESEKKNDLIQAPKMQQGRIIINLKRKYDFDKKSICVN